MKIQHGGRRSGSGRRDLGLLKKVPINVRIPPELHARLSETGIRMSTIVNEALLMYVERLDVDSEHQKLI